MAEQVNIHDAIGCEVVDVIAATETDGTDLLVLSRPSGARLLVTPVQHHDRPGADLVVETVTPREVSEAVANDAE